jgi:hypothetical protein
VPSAGLTFVIQFHHLDDKGHSPRIRTANCHLGHDRAAQYVRAEPPTYDVLFDAWFDGGGDQYGENGSEEAVIVDVRIEDEEK